MPDAIPFAIYIDHTSLYMHTAVKSQQSNKVIFSGYKLEISEPIFISIMSAIAAKTNI
jgi:hypothetical protein